MTSSGELRFMQPADTAYELSFQSFDDSNVIVRIYGDGRVVLGGGAAAHAETDAAARAFWDAVIRINPLVAARDRITALEAAGDELYDALALVNEWGKSEAMAAWEKAKEDA